MAQISNPSGNTNLPGNLLTTSTYQLVKYPRDNKPYILVNNICISSYTDNWCLVPFCINISGDCPHRMCLCFDNRNTLIYPIQFFAVVGWGWGGGVESWVHRKKILKQITPP